MDTSKGRIRFEAREELPATAISITGTDGNLTGSWKFLEPFYRNMTPPCSNQCLTGTDIVGMMRAVEVGDWDGAARLVIDSNPFPAVTGRCCPHPCQQPCNRKAMGGGVEIRAIERQVGDHKLEHGVKPALPEAAFPHVDVVGSGPAGLAAAVALRRLGHPVTVHEAAPEAGGLLRYGIPAYRLPDEIVRGEIRWVESLGVTFKTGHRLSRREIEGMGPTVLAVGFGRSRPLGIPGEDLPGVHDGLSLLSAVRRGEDVHVGRRAVVVGGGNTAMDVARTLLRRGTVPTVCYRRSAREMPAFKEEIEQAKQEGIEFVFLTTPVKVEASPAGGLRVTLVGMELGPPDASGRAKPVVKAGSERVVETDAVVKALGEVLDEGVLPEGARAEGGRIATDAAHATGAQDVFAVGDCGGHLGFTVGEAIRSGRLAAHAMHEHLTGHKVPPSSPLADRGDDPEVAKFKDLNPAYFRKEPAHVPGTAPAADRVAGFDPVEGALSLEDARAEAARCFKCGTCTECDTCFHYCPDFAIRRKPNGGYEIDLAHCKGCGVCVEECPRAAVHLRKTT